MILENKKTDLRGGLCRRDIVTAELFLSRGLGRWLCLAVFCDGELIPHRDTSEDETGYEVAPKEEVGD